MHGMNTLRFTDTQQVLDSLPEGGILVTANQQAATVLLDHHRLAASQRASAWARPNVLSFWQWIQGYHDALPSDQSLLTHFQEWLLWQSLHDECVDAAPFHPQAFKALSTWQQLWWWGLSDLGDASTEDALAFKAWSARFVTQAKQHQMMNQSMLCDAVLQAWADGVLPAPSLVWFHGFEGVPKVLQRIADVLPEVFSCALVHVAQKCSQVKVQACLDVPTEDQHMLAAAVEARRAGKRVLCLAPPDRLAAIARLWQQHAPFLDLPALHVHAGGGLLDHPWVAHAQAVFDLSQPDVDMNKLLALMRAPYWRFVFDQVAEDAMADAMAQGGMFWSRDAIANYLKVCCDAAPSHSFLRFWADFFDMALDFDGGYLPSDAASVLHDLACHIASGMRVADVDMPYQARWFSALAELPALSFDQDHVDSIDCFMLLFRSLVANIRYQAEAQVLTGVHVLTPKQAVGLSADYLWVLGMDAHYRLGEADHAFLLDAAWLQGQGVPLVLRRGMADAVLAFRRACQSMASEVVFSYPRQAHGMALLPHVVLSRLPCEALDPTEIDKVLPQRLGYDADVLCERPDTLAPRCPEGFKGGVSLLQMQAACPFQAYAVGYLGCESLETFVSGVDAQTQGVMVHALLQRLVTLYPSQDALSGLLSGAGRAQIDAEIDALIARWRVKKPWAFSPPFDGVLRSDLQALIAAWLAVELARPPFEVVGCEQSVALTLGDLTVRMRVDRMDRLACGRFLLLDYKTGLAVQDYWGDRPLAPQLPLYCLTQPADQIAGWAYVIMKKGQVAFKGLSGDALGIEGVRLLSTQAEHANVAGCMADWQAVFTRLASDVVSGLPVADPKTPSVCAYCAVKPMCRVRSDRTV